MSTNCKPHDLMKDGYLSLVFFWPSYFACLKTDTSLQFVLVEVITGTRASVHNYYAFLCGSCSIFSFLLMVSVYSISHTATKDMSLPSNTIIQNPFFSILFSNCFTTINTLSRDIFKRNKYERLKEDYRCDEQ